MTMLRLVLAIPLLAGALLAGGCDRTAAASSGDVVAASGSASTGSCSMAATWTGAYSCPGFLAGKHYNWIMNADGTATGTIDGVGPIEQKWTLAGNVLTITEHNDHCAGDGKYTVKWGAACGTMTLTKISDSCAGRGACVDKLTSKRSK